MDISTTKMRHANLEKMTHTERKSYLTSNHSKEGQGMRERVLVITTNLQHFNTRLENREAYLKHNKF
jgi:hypothetical protein